MSGQSGLPGYQVRAIRKSKNIAACSTNQPKHRRQIRRCVRARYLVRRKQNAQTLRSLFRLRYPTQRCQVCYRMLPGMRYYRMLHQYTREMLRYVMLHSKFLHVALKFPRDPVSNTWCKHQCFTAVPTIILP